MTSSFEGGTATGGAPAISAAGLTKIYPLRRGLFSAGAGEIRAVDGISFEVRRAETLGLVGESGSGKSTTGRLLVRLEEPTAGELRLDGEDWLAIGGERLRRRRRDIQMVFQDPQASLNPRLRIGTQIAEPLVIQGLARGREAAVRARDLLEEVGLPPAAAECLPSELSGGQRQRVAIARALATRPKFLVCDEPVSALDVSVGAQIINLLLDLRERMHLSALFISHDLAVVSQIADRIAVMYRGRIVEEASAAALLRNPLHPYTAALLSAALSRNDPASVPSRSALRGGEPEDTSAESAGCAYRARCPIARVRCAEEPPVLSVVSGGHAAACFYPGEIPAGVPLTKSPPV